MMIKMPKVAACVFVAALFFICLAPVAPRAQNPIYSSEVFSGEQREHFVRVNRWGRYLFEVSSAEKASLQIADKLRGVFAKSGAAGIDDGRLEIFLEAGEYKVITEGPHNASGNLKLTVTEYRLSGTSNAADTSSSYSLSGNYEYLTPHKYVETQLGLTEAKGWWIFVPRDTVVYIEAMGRYVGGLAVFRGGETLVAEASAAHGDSEESTARRRNNSGRNDVGSGSGREFVVAAIPEKPLNGLRIVRRLERGKHLVAVYGGGKDGFTVGDNASPLYVSWMPKPLEASKQVNTVIGSSGVNRYAISPNMEYFVVESSKKLFVEAYTINARSNSSSLIGRDSLNKNADMQNTYRLILRLSGDHDEIAYFSIIGNPGADVKITPVNMYRRRRSAEQQYYEYSPPQDGQYMLQTLHTGHASDNIGASGVLVDVGDDSMSIVALRADTVSAALSLRKQFNLLASVTSYLWVAETGTYVFEPDKNEMNFEWRIKRFYLKEPPENSTEPRMTSGKRTIALSAGLHIMELTPTDLGKAAFTLSKKGSAVSAGKGGVKGANPFVSFKPLVLSRDRTYLFYLNEQAPELSSIHISQYPPIDEKNIYITGAEADLEELKTERTSKLKIGTPRYTVLGIKTYEFTINKAGVYKVETTGRLLTKLAVRDRAGAVLASNSGEYGMGIGRNAIIVDYFLPGNYLLTAESMGSSAGQMGVALNKGDMYVGGKLEDGKYTRASVNVYGAAVYDFKAETDGLYRIESFGQYGAFKVRFENADGWPLFEHGKYAEWLEIKLKKGTYKLFSLPVSYESERMTGIRNIKKGVEISGLGPHRIRLNDTISALWTEEGEQKTSGENVGAYAQYRFELVAPIYANISLTPDFSGTLYSRDKDAALAEIGGATYQATLDKGKYEIRVAPVKKRNYAPYELSIVTEDLFAGIGFDVDDATNPIRVRVGEAGVYEIFSQGTSEMSARLYAGDDITEIARDGGDPQDWNFVITERLNPGTYYLKMFNVVKQDAYYSKTKIFMRRVEDTLMQAIKLDGSTGVERKISVSGKLAVIPLEISAGDILTIGASGDFRAVCELEASLEANTVTVGRKHGKTTKISAPINKDSKYTLKIRSMDRTGGDVTVAIKTVSATPLTYEKARSAVIGAAVKEQDNTTFFKIDDMNASPGHYELITSQNDIVSASGTNTAHTMFQTEEGSLIANDGKQLWIKAVFKSSDKYRFVMRPVYIADVSNIPEKNRRKFETSDKYRVSKNQIKFTGREETPVTVKSGQDKVFEIDAPIQKFGVVRFFLDVGRPIAGLSSSEQLADFVRDGKFVLGGQYIDGNVCVTAVIPGDTGRIIGWNALTGGPPSGVYGGFSMTDYSMEKADTLKIGQTVFRTQSAAAKEFNVRVGRSLIIDAKLSPRAGILHVSPNGKRDLYYGGDYGAAYALELSNGKLFLFGDAEKGDMGFIELETYATAPTLGDASGRRQTSIGELTSGGEITKLNSLDARELVRINSDNSARRKLFLSGAIESADFISRLGQITLGIKGEHTIDGLGGILLVNYTPGWGKLKLCKDDGSVSALNERRWGETVKKEGVPVVKELSKLIMADGVNWYAIELTEPTHVSVNANVQAAAIISVNGKIRNYNEFWDGLSMNVPLASGKFIVGIKPLAGTPLSGIPITIGFYPIATLTEDKPLDMYLISGQRRIAAFEVEKKSRIGIGLQSNNETTEAVLLDKFGSNIDIGGKQIFTWLDKGTYYVLLSAPPASGGNSVKLRIFGQNTPPQDPPQERIKWIIGGGVGRMPDDAESRQEASGRRGGRGIISDDYDDDYDTD